MKRAILIAAGTIGVVAFAVGFLCLLSIVNGAWYPGDNWLTRTFSPGPPHKALDPNVDAVAILPDGTIMSQTDFAKMCDVSKLSDDQLKALNKRIEDTQSLRNWKATYAGPAK